MAKTAEYGLGEFTFPRGWFVVAESAKVNTVPMSIRYFGNDMVLYRGQSGKAHLLDAYCPHMGTHLGANTTSYVVRDHQHVQGDSIRCPYHAWRFGPDGQVDDIPYFKGPYPKAACVRTWKIQEKYGMVWVWHDAEGGEPNYDLPELEEWNDPQWVRWRIDDLGTLNSHPQEFVDNICDYSHLDPIHGSTVEYFQNEFTDHVAIQRQGGGHRTLTDKKHIRNLHLVHGAILPVIADDGRRREHHDDYAYADRRWRLASLVWSLGENQFESRDRFRHRHRARLSGYEPGRVRAGFRSLVDEEACLAGDAVADRWSLRQGAHMVQAILQCARQSEGISGQGAWRAYDPGRGACAGLKASQLNSPSKRS